MRTFEVPGSGAILLIPWCPVVKPQSENLTKLIILMDPRRPSVTRGEGVSFRERLERAANTLRLQMVNAADGHVYESGTVAGRIFYSTLEYDDGPNHQRIHGSDSFELHGAGAVDEL